MYHLCYLFVSFVVSRVVCSTYAGGPRSCFCSASCTGIELWQ